MNNTVYIPKDFSASAMGVDTVLAELQKEIIKRQIEIEVIRTGSFGIYWLEPLLTVEVNGVRIAYGPVEENDVASLLDANFLSGGEHLSLIHI